MIAGASWFLNGRSICRRLVIRQLAGRSRLVPRERSMGRAGPRANAWKRRAEGDTRCRGG